MSIAIEQGTFSTSDGSYVLTLDSSLFSTAEAAPIVSATPQDAVGNVNVFITSISKNGLSWQVTFNLSDGGPGEITVAYRAMTRTVV